MKSTILLSALILTLNSTSSAQTEAPRADVQCTTTGEGTASVQVQIQAEFKINIGSYHIGRENVVDLKPTDPVYFSEERKVMMGFSVGPAPTQEGIPGSQTMPNPFDLIKDAYSTEQRISRALQTARLKPDYEQIGYFRRMARSIVQTSGVSETERPVRMALNRAVDTANNIQAIIGDNTQYARNFLIRFYVYNFELAQKFASLQRKLIYHGGPSIDPLQPTHPIADFGRMYNLLMRKFIAGLTTDQAKAVILMKSMGYLGWDLNLDLRRTGFRSLVADIYYMQTEDPSYLVVLEKLERKQPVTPDELAALSAAVGQIEDRIIPVFENVYPGLQMARM